MILHPKHSHTDQAIKLVALFEAGKGVLVLLVGFGLLGLVHRDVESIASNLVKHYHFDPAHRYPHIFMDAAAKVTDAKLWLYAGAAMAYSAVRLIEAFGLWHRKTWAEIFAVITGGLYVPLEIYELIHRATILKAITLFSNLLIVIYLGYVLWKSRGGTWVRSAEAVLKSES